MNLENFLNFPKFSSFKIKEPSKNEACTVSASRRIHRPNDAN